MGHLQTKITRRRAERLETFPDLDTLPPEVAVAVLSYLNPTDLCLAACVWDHLANNNLLWQSLCHTTWKYAPIYKNRFKMKIPYRELYMLMDEGCLLFSIFPDRGIDYLVEHHILVNEPEEIAKFINGTKRLNSTSVRNYFASRQDILLEFMKLQQYTGKFLPDCLRELFKIVNPPDERGEFLDKLLEMFATRFCSCNPHVQFTEDTVFILCQSLILLSVDLCSPHVKNKMSKREFIKNLRGVVDGASYDFIGDLYDNILLEGHVAVHPGKCSKLPFRYERPYANVLLQP